ncbi:hypothetical protein TNIN_205671 [Trichonephila inaurata madagascariensis]|uniref:Uncharacterized protein n=1 Tax=Trichonephila inaurata madagascariensis TaxID=2747483 RepID=A0A8X7C0W3_9ARAC|nr:hypothetical protein TNIN_205671 [Trichonephila inaurata madagascariensis]
MLIRDTSPSMFGQESPETPIIGDRIFCQNTLTKVNYTSTIDSDRPGFLNVIPSNVWDFEHVMTGEGIEVMGVTIGQKARNYSDTVANARILREEKTAEANCNVARTLRRTPKGAENDNFEETEGLLYTPGIAD